MTHKYDWDGIRVRFARGETAHSISKSLGGSPTRQGIRKKAKRENWPEGNSTIPDSIKNLPLVRTNSKVPRKRTPETVNALIEFIAQGATEELAARAAGISPRTLYNWKLECPEFAALIEVARARKEVEWVDNIDKAGKKDWKASDRLLQVSPGTKEMWGRQSKQESPTIILNIHRDVVTVEGKVIEQETLQEREECLPELPKKEATETAVESQAEPLQITDSPHPPRDPEGARERDRLEKERMEKCWMGADWRERQVMDEHRAREERLALGIKSR